jgi:hypothetical protein
MPSRLRHPLVVLGLLLAGIAGGLLLGWVAFPPPFEGAEPSALSQAHQDDFVLMIATAFAGDADLDAARAALARVAPGADPAVVVAATAGRLQAAEAAPMDLERLNSLARALSSPGTPAAPA